MERRHFLAGLGATLLTACTREPARVLTPPRPTETPIPSPTPPEVGAYLWPQTKESADLAERTRQILIDTHKYMQDSIEPLSEASTQIQKFYWNRRIQLLYITKDFYETFKWANPAGNLLPSGGPEFLPMVPVVGYDENTESFGILLFVNGEGIPQDARASKETLAAYFFQVYSFYKLFAPLEDMANRGDKSFRSIVEEMKETGAYPIFYRSALAFSWKELVEEVLLHPSFLQNDNIEFQLVILRETYDFCQQATKLDGYEDGPLAEANFDRCWFQLFKLPESVPPIPGIRPFLPQREA